MHVQIENNKLEWNATAKIGSLDNAQLKPAAEGNAQVSGVLFFPNPANVTEDERIFATVMRVIVCVCVRPSVRPSVRHV
jgi:hypothetical protein